MCGEKLDRRQPQHREMRIARAKNQAQTKMNTSGAHPRPWRKRPGSWDSLRQYLLFPSSNPYGFPDLLPQPPGLDIPPSLFPHLYCKEIKTTRPVLIYFYTEDFRFEVVWNEPHKGLKAVCRPRKVWGAVAPDFSLYAHYPKIMNQWQWYREMWVARLWQERGVTVIPTVSTPIGVYLHSNGDREIFEWSFPTIPRGQILSLHTWYYNQSERVKWMEGYKIMLDMLEPRRLLWFGHIYDEATDNVPKMYFEVGHWDREQRQRVVAGNIATEGAIEGKEM